MVTSVYAFKPIPVDARSKAMSCMAATSVHTLPCACGRLAFLCPTWQPPASSTMASLRTRNLFLLENSAFNFDWSGVERRSKHGIFQSRYQLGEFNHLYNELRKNSNKFFEYCRMSPLTFDYIVQALRQHISHISTNFQKTISVEDCDTAVSPTCYTFNTHYSVPWWSQFDSFIMTQIYW